jgi:hypothetical protein
MISFSHAGRLACVRKPGPPYDQVLARRPKISATRNKTRKMTNKTFAIQAAVPAMPAKPSNPANNAIMRNMKDQPNIMNLSFYCWCSNVFLASTHRYKETPLLRRIRRTAKVEYAREMPPAFCYKTEVFSANRCLLTNPGQTHPCKLRLIRRRCLQNATRSMPQF